jgi:transcriptional regulator with PAS, ATPase and Fis domain
MDPSRTLNPKLSHDFAHNRERALKTILKAIEAESGNLNATARKLSISIDTMRRWVAKEPRIREALDAARIKAIKEAP